jgi:hypothetical protein
MRRLLIRWCGPGSDEKSLPLLDLGFTPSSLEADALDTAVVCDWRTPPVRDRPTNRGKSPIGLIRL